ncbi:hypothetical protein NUSPORA_01855 [Nucleospora cyclopteri]
MEDPTKTNKKLALSKDSSNIITGLDLGGQGIKVLDNVIFCYNSIKELLLNNNEIEVIPKDIYKLRKLEKLNLSNNKIKSIPTELGKLVTLKELYLNDNAITAVPLELGGLHNLEVLNLANNPLIAPFCEMAREKSLLRFCRENNTNYKPPADRAWIDTVIKTDPHLEAISVGTYNILTNYWASKLTYAPSWVINAECRKETILQNIIAYNLDILCLQEVEIPMYHEYFKDNLAQRLDYESVFLPKRKDASKRIATSHGQATFWKKSKFTLIEQIDVEFLTKIKNDPRLRGANDILHRFEDKTHTALFTVLNHTILNCTIIISNVHLFWDPEFEDVKLLQSIILIDELEKVKNKYKTAQVLLMGDFNSTCNSTVVEYILQRKILPSVFLPYSYGDFDEGSRHNLRFENSYDQQDITFTNFTPSYKGVIDHIFYSENLFLIAVISPVEDVYTERTIGLPNIHFPSDHILIGAKFHLKDKKQNK